jgi:hypothetical protein
MTAMNNVESVQKTNGKDLHPSDLLAAQAGEVKPAAKREAKREARLTSDLIENGRRRAPSVSVFSRSWEPVSVEQRDSVGDDAAEIDFSEPMPEVEALALEADEPTLDADAPTLEADEPVLEFDAPTLDDDEPVLEFDAPTLDDDEPVLEFDAPTLDDDEPVLEFDAPTLEASEPMLEAEAPTLEVEVAMLEADAPALDEESMPEAQAATSELVDTAASPEADESGDVDEQQGDYIVLFLKCCIVFFASAAISTLLL